MITIKNNYKFISFFLILVNIIQRKLKIITMASCGNKSNKRCANSYVEFCKHINDIGKKGFIYRGQKNATWKVITSAANRLDSKDDELAYNLGLITEAKRAGFYRGIGACKMDTELGILAQLQHNGAATSMIDFSSYSMVALWFACERMYDSKDPKKELDGKVFVLSIKDESKIKNIDELVELDSLNIDNILTSNECYYWKMDDSNNKRMSAQDSYFIIGNIKSLSMEEIIIPHTAKASIRKYLEAKFSIKETSIYPDAIGFARANSYTSQYNNERKDSILRETRQYNNNETNHYKVKGSLFKNISECRQLSDEPQKALGYYDEAIKKYPKDLDLQEKHKLSQNIINNIKEEIKWYEKRIAIDENDHESHCKIGHCKSKLNDMKGAIPYFTKSISINDGYGEAYYGRGFSKYKQDNFQESIKDFSKSIKYNYEVYDSYCHRGLAYYQLGFKKEKVNNFKRAITDFTDAINIQSYGKNYSHQKNHPHFKKDDYFKNNIYFRRGLAKYEIGNIEEAIFDYTKVISVSYGYAPAYYRRGEASEKLFDKTSKCIHYKEAILDYRRTIKFTESDMLSQDERQARKDAQKALKRLKSNSRIRNIK